MGTKYGTLKNSTVVFQSKRGSENEDIRTSLNQTITRMNQEKKSALDLATLASRLDSKYNLGIVHESSHKLDYLAKSKSQSKLGKSSDHNLLLSDQNNHTLNHDLEDYENQILNHS